MPCNDRERANWAKLEVTKQLRAEIEADLSFLQQELCTDLDIIATTKLRGIYAGVRAVLDWIEGKEPIRTNIKEEINHGH